MLLDKILGAAPSHRPATSYFIPMRSTSGVRVDEDTALTFAAVFGAVKAISETVAMLPWRVYEEDGDSRILQAGTALDRVLHRVPNEYMTAFSWREYMIASALLWGNAYSEIQRNQVGEIVSLYPFHPKWVTPKFDDNGRLYYEVQYEDGQKPDEIDYTRMYHLRGPTRDGIVGWSVISLARDSWGLGLAADQFAGSFFGNGGTPSLVIQQDEGAPDLSPEGATNMLESFDRRHKGTKNAGKTAYLERGFKIETVGVPQKDAQFVEQKKHTVLDVARWFRIPPHKIQSMEAASFSNIEQQAIEYVTDTIQPWVQRMEEEADIKLLDKDTRFATKMNINGLLRGDSAARSDFYQKLWGIGVYSPNDIRRMEDDNPVEGGNQRFVPLNMVTLDRASQSGSTEPATAMRDVVIESHKRMIDKEYLACSRANDKDKDMNEWMESFYPKHHEQMIEALKPSIHAIANCYNMDTTIADSVLESHVSQHIESSKKDVVAGNWQDWEHRTVKQADRLIERVLSAR